MNKNSTRIKLLLISLFFAVAFIAFTIVVAFVDVDGVGLSQINHFFLNLCGRNLVWENITDWLGYLTICGLLFFIGLQVWQWIRRKSLRKIDWNLFCFDFVCVALVVVYIIFEFLIINYRPYLDNGVAKASYPSSHAMLFATILPMIIYQIWHYVKNKPWRIVLTTLIGIILVLGIVGRLLSGLHWFTDIVAGLIISVCLNTFYWGLVIKSK